MHIYKTSITHIKYDIWRYATNLYFNNHKAIVTYVS